MGNLQAYGREYWIAVEILERFDIEVWNAGEAQEYGEIWDV